MIYGFFSDSELPKFEPYKSYKTNSYGYRCPEFSKHLEGGKNIVVLGCSHTFGEGLEDNEIWVDILAKNLEDKRSIKKLRWWNLARPGGSADQMIRILYATEKFLFPNIIIACWPLISRRERLDNDPQNLTSDSEFLKIETTNTDKNNFLRNVFLLEKFAEKNKAKTFHCFAEEYISLEADLNILKDKTLSNCWPEWNQERIIVNDPNLARDGLHYGVEHHRVFAKLLEEKFKLKLK
jgi:hypothetical protein